MPSGAHKLSFLPVLASVVLVIGSLYWARAVFVPLALSLMLTFLLQPVVAVLHRWGLGYAPAAGLVVLLLAFLIGAIGWVAVTQLSNLASELPRYQGNRVCSHFSGQASSRARCEVAICFNIFHRPAL